MMNKNPAVLNLFGGPGVGKSTTAAGVFSLLKLHNIECELVTEFAKELVWEERVKTFEDQNYLFGKQYHRMWRLKGKVDIMITDSPLLLSIVYRSEDLSNNFVNHVVDTINNFNNINVVLTRTKKYNPNGRNETKDQAKKIDRKIIEVLEDKDMPWTTIGGNFEGINQIVKKILEDEQKFKISM